MVKSKDKKNDPVMNEAERAHVIIDRYIRNEDDRAELKKHLTPLIVQFLLRWDNDKELVMEERIVEIVMKKMQEVYLADNENLCTNVAIAVKKELAETLASWNVRLGGIEKALEGVAAWQQSVDDLIKKIDDRVETLEDIKKTDDERIKRLERFASWRSWLIRKIVVVIITVALALVLFFQILNSRLKTLDKMQEILEEHVKTEIPK